MLDEEGWAPLSPLCNVVNSHERTRRVYEKDGHCCFVGVGGGGRVSAASALRRGDSRRHDRRWHGQSVVSGGHRNYRRAKAKDREDFAFRGGAGGERGPANPARR